MKMVREHSRTLRFPECGYTIETMQMSGYTSQIVLLWKYHAQEWSYLLACVRRGHHSITHTVIAGLPYMQRSSAKTAGISHIKSVSYFPRPSEVQECASNLAIMHLTKQCCIIVYITKTICAMAVLGSATMPCHLPFISTKRAVLTHFNELEQA